jgi:hypothetical protein
LHRRRLGRPPDFVVATAVNQMSATGATTAAAYTCRPRRTGCRSARTSGPAAGSRRTGSPRGGRHDGEQRRQGTDGRGEDQPARAPGHRPGRRHRARPTRPGNWTHAFATAQGRGSLANFLAPDNTSQAAAHRSHRIASWGGGPGAGESTTGGHRPAPAHRPPDSPPAVPPGPLHVRAHCGAPPRNRQIYRWATSHDLALMEHRRSHC